MTYIEFFDKNATENIVACLAKAPEKVILIGNRREELIKQTELYESFFADRDKHIDFVPMPLDSKKLDSIVDALSKIVDEEPDCIFDLTGGEDLYLVAVGIISEKYKERHIQMHRFNIRNSTVEDCDRDGITVVTEGIPAITVRDNIRIYGGNIKYTNNVFSRGTYEWLMDGEFVEDIKRMWDICKTDVRKWNTQINVFQAASECAVDNELSISISHSRLIRQLKNKEYVEFKDIITALKKAGVITAYSSNETEFKITFKNPQVKKCLTKAGQVLEMIVFHYVKQATDNKNNRMYNDVVNGVSIDWDGILNVKYETENEIDILAMRGIWPMFISCKNGAFDAEELYKLNTVAHRFGGKYAKKVLIATALDAMDETGKYIRQRAEDMGIIVIDNITDKNEKELLKIMAGLKSR